MTLPRTTIASAPTRVDLAGGTLDIWPLHLLVEHAVTVNVAVDLRARVRVSPSGSASHLVISEDLKREVRIGSSRFEGPASSRDLPLHAAILRHLAPEGGLAVVTRSEVPAGSGLGGSSSLAIALLAAVLAARGESPEAGALVTLARDLEAQVIGAPTGTQDHLAAVHGGISAIEWRPGGAIRRELHPGSDLLESWGVLAYLGASRASARANWDMVRRALDEDPATRRGLSQIGAIAAAMARALERCDFEEASRLLDAEWVERRGLSPEVSTGATESALAAARRAGATGGKICGAGGGGCLFVMGPPEARGQIAAALQGAGCRVLEFRVAARGLSVEFPEEGAA